MRIDIKEMPEDDGPPIEHETKEIDCILCEAPLVNFVQIIGVAGGGKFQFLCPHCENGKSFIITADKKTYIDPIDCKIENLEEKDGLCLVNLKC